MTKNEIAVDLWSRLRMKSIVQSFRQGAKSLKLNETWTKAQKTTRVLLDETVKMENRQAVAKEERKTDVWNPKFLTKPNGRSMMEKQMRRTPKPYVIVNAVLWKVCKKDFSANVSRRRLNDQSGWSWNWPTSRLKGYSMETHCDGKGRISLTWQLWLKNHLLKCLPVNKRKWRKKTNQKVEKTN